VKARELLRLAARFGAIAVGGVAAVMIAAQYAHIVHRNISYALQLRDVQNEIATLQQKRSAQQREIARLSDPEGAIPEIHDRLHLVGDHEAIIYLKRHDEPSGHE
jgi:cell division protein FtsB